MTKQKKSATALVVAAGILWGTIGLFVRNLSGFDSMQLVAFRAILTALVLFLFVFIKDPSKLKVRWQDLWCFGGTGIASFVFFNFCYFQAIRRTSLSTAAILLYTAPFFVMLLSTVLFKEKITVKKIGALLLAFAGCVCVAGFSGGRGGWGLVFGVLSGIGYALYSIFARYALEKYDTYTVTVYTFLFAAVGTLPFFRLDNLGALAAPNPWVLVLVIGMGFVTTVFPYLLYTKGLEGVESSKASIMASVEPVVATLIGAAVFGESLTFFSGLGVVLVIGAVVWLNLPEKAGQEER